MDFTEQESAAAVTASRSILVTSGMNAIAHTVEGLDSPNRSTLVSLISPRPSAR